MLYKKQLLLWETLHKNIESAKSHEINNFKEVIQRLKHNERQKDYQLMMLNKSRGSHKK